MNTDLPVRLLEEQQCLTVPTDVGLERHGSTTSHEPLSAFLGPFRKMPNSLRTVNFYVVGVAVELPITHISDGFQVA